MANKDIALQDLLIYECLQKRIPVLNQLAEGLSEGGFITFMRQFPSQLQGLFVHSKESELRPEQVHSLINGPREMKPAEEQTLLNLKHYILDSTEKGLSLRMFC